MYDRATRHKVRHGHGQRISQAAADQVVDQHEMTRRLPCIRLSSRSASERLRWCMNSDATTTSKDSSGTGSKASPMQNSISAPRRGGAPPSDFDGRATLVAADHPDVNAAPPQALPERNRHVAAAGGEIQDGKRAAAQAPGQIADGGRRCRRRG